jgi:pilus assembly protein FimV
MTATQVTPVAPAAPDPGGGLDFKLDIPDLNLGDQPQAAAGGEKDGHWYDVQTKFDLAKAYQEMGDKDGAREILQEVIKEGDAEQQAQAKTLLETLG